MNDLYMFNLRSVFAMKFITLLNTNTQTHFITKSSHFVITITICNKTVAFCNQKIGRIL